MNDKKGGVCPFGHGLLARARVELDDGGEAFYLERCTTCSGVFFDDGEWARLAHSRMFAHLDEFWDPLFQQRLAEERSRERWRADLVEKLSAGTVDDMERLVATLSAVPRGHASDGLAWLTSRLRDAWRAEDETPAPARRKRKVDAVLLHVVAATQRLESYVPASLSTEGFVHLCHRDQLIGVLQRHFTDREARERTLDLNVLVLDPASLLSPVREEVVGDVGVFPHLYGPLRSEAILKVIPIERDLSGDEILRRVDDAIEDPHDT
jgi:uncharacterized protein (DUF952 family)/Zn-finger nucleic acid-binding protein